ncbi:hypothetical protein BSIN_0383 [Burkholderia singularis]|uniref:Uncharacterized protein n=1 Tax=Burkholderia singularis TaxID=1503053 RepID=A0A238H6Q1_9BURK|nr:hypothetical protein BSIN_0383 [Burkholderia singularis]
MQAGCRISVSTRSGFTRLIEKIDLRKNDLPMLHAKKITDTKE